MGSPEEVVPPGVDPSKPNVARIYDLYLGGTVNYESDRKVVEKIRELVPDYEDAIWANRGFLQRSASWMAAKAGISQFIDIGAGLPTRNNTHEAVQRVNPGARVAYVDNDPTVVAHGQHLVAGIESVAFVEGDLLDPDGIFQHPEVRRVIDFNQPIGLVMVAVVHFASDEDDPWGLLQRYIAELPSGSYVAMSHVTSERQDPDTIREGVQVYNDGGLNIYVRPRADIERLFTGLEMVPPYPGAPPGISYVGLWGAEDPDEADSDGNRWIFAGVGRKP